MCLLTPPLPHKSTSTSTCGEVQQGAQCAWGCGTDSHTMRWPRFDIHPHCLCQFSYPIGKITSLIFSSLSFLPQIPTLTFLELNGIHKSLICSILICQQFCLPFRKALIPNISEMFQGKVSNRCRLWIGKQAIQGPGQAVVHLAFTLSCEALGLNHF